MGKGLVRTGFFSFYKVLCVFCFSVHCAGQIWLSSIAYVDVGSHSNLQKLVR